MNTTIILAIYGIIFCVMLLILNNIVLAPMVSKADVVACVSRICVVRRQVNALNINVFRQSSPHLTCQHTRAGTPSLAPRKTPLTALIVPCCERRR